MSFMFRCQVSLCLDGLLQGADIDPAENTARFLELCSLVFAEFWRYLGTAPHPGCQSIPFLVGNPYKSSFVTVTGWGGRFKRYPPEN